jgi:hypothetical protein
MADTIDIAGKPVKKQTVIVASAGIVIIGVAAVRYRKQQQTAAAAASAAAAAQAPGTGAGTSDQIDPATGFPYGSVEDASALTSQAAYNTPTNYLYGGGGSASSYVPNSGGFTSNAQWAQAAEDYLVNTAGADSASVGNALGKYITGGVLDSTMAAIVNQAIAFEGYPPIPGPDGYPPSIRNAPPTTTVPPPADGGTTTPAADRLYHTTGGKSLAQIATILHVDSPDIVSKTAARDYNQGRAWPYLSDWNKVIPTGITLVY